MYSVLPGLWTLPLYNISKRTQKFSEAESVSFLRWKCERGIYLGKKNKSDWKWSLMVDLVEPPFHLRIEIDLVSEILYFSE